MNRKTRVLPGARAEFADATEWYEDRRPGLGKEFASAVRSAFHEIDERPLSWPRWQRLPEYRYFVMQRFPYTVFYRVTDDELQITAVAHGKRRPGYWVDRNAEDEEATPTGEHLKVLQRAIDAGQRDVDAGNVVPAQVVLKDLEAGSTPQTSS